MKDAMILVSPQLILDRTIGTPLSNLATDGDVLWQLFETPSASFRSLRSVPHENPLKDSPIASCETISVTFRKAAAVGFTAP